MQYLLSVIHDSTDLATPAEMAAIDVFNDRLQADGQWVFAGGLGGPDMATVIDNRGAETLVTDGLYGYVRHPMYSSFILFAVAQALLLQNWIAGPIGLVAIAILFFLRVPREEQMMIETFGQSYREYMRRTARIVPWVY